MPSNNPPRFPQWVLDQAAKCSDEDYRRLLDTIDPAPQGAPKETIMQIDPNGHYRHLAHEAILATCGPIPQWAQDYADSGADTGMVEHLRYCYGLPVEHIKGAQVADDGVYSYPGDPPQHPIVKIQAGAETFYQYPRAFIAVVSPHGALVARMD